MSTMNIQKGLVSNLNNKKISSSDVYMVFTKENLELLISSLLNDESVVKFDVGRQEEIDERGSLISYYMVGVLRNYN